jgi:hypothetical protein
MIHHDPPVYSGREKPAEHGELNKVKVAPKTTAWMTLTDL